VRPAPQKKQKAVHSEKIILFRVGEQIFAISSSSVQEVRSVDGFAGLTKEISVPGLKKVRHTVQRGDRTVFVVNAALHFGMLQTHSTLIFVLRGTRTALLIDGIEQMTSMIHLQALPLAFCNEERQWYRGLTTLDQTIVPVVDPDGFLSGQELALLDAALLQDAHLQEQTVTPAESPGTESVSG
jgi:chemotaxis signal transduction protein